MPLRYAAPESDPQLATSKDALKNEIMTSLENIQRQISDLQLEHRTLQTQMLRIDVMQRKLITEQTNLVNKLLAVNAEPKITIQSLPAEILHLVFQQYIADGSASIYDLTATCRVWRDICHEYPDLWTLLNISGSTTPEEIQMRLELSKEHDLTFQITVEPAYTHFSRAVLDLMKPVVGRWVSLKLKASHTDFNDLILDRLLYLEPVQLQHISLHPAVTGSLELTESHIVTLRKYIRRFGALSKRLRSLHLDGVCGVLCLETLVPLFKVVPNLTHYSFTAPNADLNTIITTIIHYYDTPEDPDAVVLPRLISLEMWLQKLDLTDEYQGPLLKQLIEGRRNIPDTRRKELAQLQSVTLHIPESQVEGTKELLEAVIESGMDVFINKL